MFSVAWVGISVTQVRTLLQSLYQTLINRLEIVTQVTKQVSTTETKQAHNPHRVNDLETNKVTGFASGNCQIKCIYANAGEHDRRML